MQGEFLVAKPAQNQSPSDSIIEPTVLGSAELAGPDQASAGPTSPCPVVTPISGQAGGGWFYLVHGQPVGPRTTEVMKTLLRTGKVSQAVFAWRDGMEIWMPIEDIPQLHVDPEPQAKVSLSRVSPSRAVRVGRVAHHAGNMLWMSISALCMVVLLLVMRESLKDFGPAVPRITAMVLGAAMLLCLGGGIVRLVQYWRIFHRSSATVRAKWLSGATGLLICILLTGLIGFHSSHDAAGLQSDDSIELAKRIVDTLLFKDLSEANYLVDWDKLIVNGENFGQKYTNAPSMEDKQLLIEDVYETFINAMDPPFDRVHMQARAMKNWRVVQQKMDRTVVSATRPRSGAEMLFTLQGDRLIALRIIKPSQSETGP
jgi:hypothetical protein